MTYQMTLAALADPTRQKLIEALHSGPQNVAALARTVPVSRPAVSQHLKVLSDAGLLTVSPNGTRRIYSLNPQGAQPLRDYLDRMWDDALSSFASHLEETDE